MIPFWFKLSYLIFVAALVPAYILEYGLVHFLWFSNVALMGGLVAAWLENRRRPMSGSGSCWQSVCPLGG